MLSLSPKYLGRYRDIAALLIKYGRSDLVRATKFDSSEDGQSTTNAGKGGPDELASDLEKLGPAFVKLGQLLSTRGEILPPEYLEGLSRLQDDNEPIAWEDIRELLAEQYEADPLKIFAEINPEPAATASLGQVHHAQLRDGREIVIKVQRPDLQPNLDDDLTALEMLAEELHQHTDFGRKYQLVNMVRNLRKSITGELNYSREAANAVRLKNALQDYERLLVPAPIEDLCRPKVLVTEKVCGTKITELSGVVLVDVDGKSLADELFEAYLQQVLVDGLFHADPHPGNIWLTHDHRLAILDTGLMVHVRPEIRAALLQLLLAIANADATEAVSIADRHGRKTEKYDPVELRQRVGDVLAEHHGAAVKDMNAGRVIIELQAAACEAGVILPDEVTMLGKTLLNLDKVVHILDEGFNPTEAIKTHSSQIVGEHGEANLSWTRVYHSMLESADFLQNLPKRANEISRRVAESDFHIGVDAIDEGRLIAGMQKIANRITAGLIIAALILAATRLMTFDTDWKLFGYPGLALCFFAASTLLGGFVLWQILVSDRHAE